jgi:ATP-dependent Clp protease ATP-binding subunit ClpA
MFERFTEPARRALFFAHYEATESGVRAITPEHLLLGLCHQASGALRPMFARWNIAADVLRGRVQEGFASGGKFPASVEIPFSPEAQRALQFAVAESDRLLNDYIGSEHVLLGIIRVDESHAARVLHELGVRLDEAREVAATIPAPPAEFAPFALEDVFDPLKESARGFDQVEGLLAQIEELDRRLIDDPGPRAMLERLRAQLRELRETLGL